MLAGRTTSIQIPAGSTRSHNLEVLPDINAEPENTKVAIEALPNRSPDEARPNSGAGIDYSQDLYHGSGKFPDQ